VVASARLAHAGETVEQGTGLGGRIGIALGSGSARGWAHVGVIRGLAAAGIAPEVVAGCSSGALVGAMYAAGRLDLFEAWGRSLDRRQVFGYFDLTFRGGIIKARRLLDQIAADLPVANIEELPRPFACIATDLGSGREVWLRRGPLLEALRASFAVPGLIAPVRIDGRWLVDGGVVNPVPISLCRAMGADTVIAVDLNAARLDGAREEVPAGAAGAEEPGAADGEARPSIYEVLARSLHVMQVRITRSRMAGDPPDLLVTPRLADFGLLDFDRASEAIAEGERAVRQALAAARGV
jgi:NTE family protein